MDYAYLSCAYGYKFLLDRLDEEACAVYMSHYNFRSAENGHSEQEFQDRFVQSARFQLHFS